MKKYFFWLTAFLIIAIDSYSIAQCTEKQMTLTLDKRGKIQIVLIGTGEVSIDWGDGTKKTYTLTEKDLYRFRHLRYKSGRRITHRYKDTQSRNITITGGNISSLRCIGIGLTNLDVSNNSSLKYLNCNKNQLTTLDGNLNNELLWLDCDDNQLTGLDLSGKNELYILHISRNSLSTAALNDMFESLHDRTKTEFKAVTIEGNPGARWSDVCIALKKGWTVTLVAGVANIIP